MFAVTKNPLGSQVQITSDQRDYLGNPNYDYKIPDSPETKKKRKVKSKNKKNKIKRRRDKRRNRKQNLNSEIPEETIIEFRKTFDRQVSNDSSSENEIQAPRQRSFLEYPDYDYDLHPLGQREEVPQDVSSSIGDGIVGHQVVIRWQLVILYNVSCVIKSDHFEIFIFTSSHPLPRILYSYRITSGTQGRTTSWTTPITITIWSHLVKRETWSNKRAMCRPVLGI